MASNVLFVDYVKFKKGFHPKAYILDEDAIYSCKTYNPVHQMYAC